MTFINKCITLIELLVAEPDIAKRRLLPTKATARVIRFTLIELLACPAKLLDKARRRSSMCFTLIELLVVIAIISILMTILLPALKNTRLSTLSINCISNIKQTGTCLSLYSNDWEGFLPKFYDAGANATWPKILIDYDYAPKPQYQKPYIMVCPLQRPKVWSWIGATYGTPNYCLSTCYGIRSLPTQIRILKITNPSNYFILGDSRDDVPTIEAAYQWYYLEAGGGGGDKFFHLRHFKKANVLFADFSVRGTGGTYFDEQGTPYIDQDYNP